VLLLQINVLKGHDDKSIITGTAIQLFTARVFLIYF
jgi:hypothetical protein